MSVPAAARRHTSLPLWLLAVVVGVLALVAHPAAAHAATLAGTRVGASTVVVSTDVGVPPPLVADRERGNTPTYDEHASRTPVATEDAAAAGGRLSLGDAVAACHSFAAGTLVVLADGSTKAIDNVAVGDRVRTTDPATGEEVARTVTRLHLDHDTDMADVVVRDGAGEEATVHTTQHHRFWDDSSGSWVDAAALLTHDRLHTDDGATVTVLTVRSWTAATWMYDLTVDDVHAFYVLAGSDAVLVHNCAAPNMTPWGWTGSPAYRGIVDTVDQGGTIRGLGPNETIPGEDQALQLINDSGGTWLRTEGPHNAPNPHDFWHINYTTSNGERGTIEIQPPG